MVSINRFVPSHERSGQAYAVRQARGIPAFVLHAIRQTSSVFTLGAILALSMMPCSEAWASTTPTTTSGNVTNGATDYSTYGCTGCHTNPTSPYPAQLNAANSGSLVHYMNTTYSMGSALPNSTVENDIAAYIASYVSLATSLSTGYNTASSATSTNITLAASSYPSVITSITTVTSPAKGTVSYSSGTTPYVPTFTFTPYTGACGSDSFAYGGTGGDSTSKRTISVTIGNPPIPTISGTLSFSGTYGTTSASFINVASSTSSSQSATYCGATRYSATSVSYGGAYTSTTTGWPAGVTLNTSTGVISGTPTAAGSYSITVYAINPGGPSAGKAISVTINQASQTISFGSAPAVLVGGTGSASATATSGLAVSYSTTSTDCSVNASTGLVTGINAGTNNCTIAANQSGNTNYSAASQVTQTFSIGKGNQTISFGVAPTVIYGGTGTASATTTSGLTITYGTTTSGACSVNSSSGLVTGLAGGTSNCTITADQGGDSNWNAATQKTQTISIGKASQTISFGSAPTVTVGGTGTASATATSTLAVVYSTTTPSYCSVDSSSGLVSGIASGTCTIAANQAGDTNYSAATQVTQNIAIGLNSQTITFGAAPTVIYGGAGSVSATASSGLSVTYGTSTPSACSVNSSSGLVTGLAGGTNNCTITADQAGDTTYAAATQATQTFSIGKASQTISFGSAPTVVVGGTGSASATATSTLAVSYSSSTPSTCSVNSGTGVVTGIAAGTNNCTIAANQSGNTNYSAASQVTQTFSIGKGSQTISFGSAPTVTYGGTGTASATATSALAVSYGTTTPSACSVNSSSGVVSGLVAGTNNCTITANQAGDSNWNAAAQATQTISIGMASQAIAFGSAPTVAVGGSGTVSATGGGSGNPVVFTSTTTAICTVSGTNGSTVTGVTAGTCIIAANQAGNTNYAAATQVTQSFAIGQGTQTLTFGTAPTVLLGAAGTVSATSSAGLTPVTFSSLTTSVCTVSGTNGSVVTGVAAGTCTIAADQAGDANYTAAAQVTQTLTVTIAAPATLTQAVALNTPTTFDLSSGITGYTVTGAAIVTSPAHGTVTISGTNATYTPVDNYFGSDQFTYVVYGGGGTSAPGVIKLIVATASTRPDPTKDANVTGLLGSQEDTAQRFSVAQIENFQHRMESLHQRTTGGGDGTSGFADTRSPGQAMDAAAAGNSFTGGAAGTGTATSSSNVSAGAGAGGTGETAPMLKSVQLANDLVSLLTSQTLNLSMSDQGGNGTSSAGDLHFWAEGMANFGSRDATGTLSGLDFTTNGISIGADRRLGDSFVLGFGFGFARDKTNIGTEGSTSRAHGSSMTLYGSYQPSDQTFIDALLGYGSLSFKTQRYVAPINDFAYGDRNGYQLFGSVASGYEYQDNRLLVSPYARLDYAADHLNQSTETGAGAYALTYFSQVTTSLQGALGIRVQAVHDTSFGTATPRVRAEYRHDFRGQRQASIAYADLVNGPIYSYATGTVVENAFALGIGDDFVLRSNGMKFGVDYQLLHAISSNDVTQSIVFNMSRSLDQRGGLSRALGYHVDAGFMFDDNVTRSKDAGFILSDRSYSMDISKGDIWPLSYNTRMLLTGSLGAEKFDHYYGLSHVFAGAAAEYQYRRSAEFSEPIYSGFVKAFADQFDSELRDGYRYSAGVSMKEAITDRIQIFGALAHNGRSSKSAVFDTRDNSARMNIDYTATRTGTLYLTGEYRRGDVISSGPGTIENIDTAKVLVQDDAFPGGQIFSYRFDGKTVLTTVGYNIGFGPRDSIDFSWRRVKSTPDWRPSYATSPSSYKTNQYSLVYLVTF